MDNGTIWTRPGYKVFEAYFWWDYLGFKEYIYVLQLLQVRWRWKMSLKWGSS